MAIKTIVEFNEDKCKGCELCVSVCPKKILRVDREQVNARGYHPAGVRDTTLCIGCGSCTMICPDGVIRLVKE